MGNNLGLRLPLKHTGKSLDLCSSSQLKTCSSERHIANDRLSSLPDEILFSILSFLTFKEVAMTSLLSHRWLNLWLDTPVLTFHTPDPEAASLSSKVCLYYVTWVNRVLQRHRGQYLAKFEIVCDLDIHYQEDIDNWLVFAFSRKVQRLELNLSHHASSPTRSEINYVFPDQLLGFSSGKANSNGGQFDLECLKHLSLKNVDVTCEAINMFLLHCPFLERLEVGDTDKLVNLEISGPNLALKYLKIKRCFNLEVLSISNFNLVSLDIVSVGDLTLTDLPMLVELSISMKFGLSLSHCFSQATSCHSELEALALREITRFKDIIELSKLDRLTKLTKLKRLTIEVGTFGDESLTVLFSIINPCPCLEEFTLELLSFGLDKRAIIEVERNRSSPKNHSLKVFEFSGYNGCVSNDELISHIVENAVRLEKIIIDPYDGPWCVSNPTGMEARSLALKQLKDLRKSGSIPPHVEVVIREPYTLNACASLWHWNDER